MESSVEKKQKPPSIPKYVAISLVISLLLLAITALIEKHSIGHRVEILTYEFLQEQLSPFDANNCPVVVVDISQVKRDENQVTRREDLKNIVRAIVEQNPRAIAIDIDFSPDENGWRTDDDPDFFDFCLEMKREKRVPIFLGVSEAKEDPPDTWLGLEKYKELAVAIVARDEDTCRAPLWIQAKSVSERLPTLSSALVEVEPHPSFAPPKWLAWVIEMTSDNRPGTERQAGNFKFADTLVNYSKLEALQHEALVTVSPQSVAEAGKANRFHDKMVILGDATEFTDTYNIPGRDKPVAGVFLHASAVYTLVKEPLYKLKHHVRFFVDLMISFLIISGVALLRSRHPKADEHFWHKWRSRFIYGAIIIVLIAGVMSVRLIGVMWLDFFLVGFAVLLHPTAEGWFDTFWKTRKRQVPDQGQSTVGPSDSDALQDTAK